MNLMGEHTQHTGGMSCKRDISYKPKKLMAFFSQPQQRHSKDGASYFSTLLMWASAERGDHNTNNSSQVKGKSHPPVLREAREI